MQNLLMQCLLYIYEGPLASYRKRIMAILALSEANNCVKKFGSGYRIIMFTYLIGVEYRIILMTDIFYRNRISYKLNYNNLSEADIE